MGNVDFVFGNHRFKRFTCTRLILANEFQSNFARLHRNDDFYFTFFRKRPIVSTCNEWRNQFYYSFTDFDGGKLCACHYIRFHLQVKCHRIAN